MVINQEPLWLFFFLALMAFRKAVIEDDCQFLVYI